LLRRFVSLYRYGLVFEPIHDKEFLSLPEILKWGRDLTIKVLYQYHCIRPSDRDLVVLVADLKLEEPFIKDQFAARVADKPFTSELILFDWGGLEDHAVGSKNRYG